MLESLWREAVAAHPLLGRAAQLWGPSPGESLSTTEGVMCPIKGPPKGCPDPAARCRRPSVQQGTVSNWPPTGEAPGHSHLPKACVNPGNPSLVRMCGSVVWDPHHQGDRMEESSETWWDPWTGDKAVTHNPCHPLPVPPPPRHPSFSSLLFSLFLFASLTIQ